MSSDRKTSAKDDEELDDTVNRQMKTSGVTGVVRKLRQKAEDGREKKKERDEDEA